MKVSPGRLNELSSELGYRRSYVSDDEGEGPD
jgi:hypothetical protein